MGPFLFLIYELTTTVKSLTDIMRKYADDSLLVQKHADFRMQIPFEFECENTQRWKLDNKLMMNYSKTKEYVFKRPSLRSFVRPLPLVKIEQVQIL